MTRIILLIGIIFIYSCKNKNLNFLTRKEKKQNWKLLFNGFDFNSWRFQNSIEDNQNWEIKNQITSSSNTDNVVHDLITKQVFKDFEFKFDFKLSNDNDLIFYLKTREPSIKGIEGIKISIGKQSDFEYRLYLSIYKDYIPIKLKKKKKWNQVRVKIINNHLFIFFNDEKIIDFFVNDKLRFLQESGYIVFYPSKSLSLKQIKVRNLNKKK